MLPFAFQNYHTTEEYLIIGGGEIFKKNTDGGGTLEISRKKRWDVIHIGGGLPIKGG